MSNINLFATNKRFIVLSKITRCLAYFLLTCTLGLGITVIIGWCTHNLPIIQIHNTFVPMQLNTALSFVLLSLGVFATRMNLKLIANIFALVTLTFSCLVLMEYALALNYSLDQLLIQHNIVTEGISQGKVAPNTAICFIIASISIFILTTDRYTSKKNLILILINFLLFLFAYIPFIKYCFGVSTLSRWAYSSNMAIHTSVGMMMWGLSLIAIGLTESMERNYKSHTQYTMLSFLVSAIIFIILWQFSIYYESDIIKKTIYNSSVELNEKLNNKLTIEYYSLSRLAHRHTVNDPNEYWDWTDDVDLYLAHHDSIFLIAKINNKKDVLSPHVKDDKYVNIPSLKFVIKDLKVNMLSISSQVIKIDNTKYILAFFPMDSEGGVIALYNANTLIKSIISKAEDNLYNLSISLNNISFITQVKDSSISLKKQWQTIKSFNIFNDTFKLTTWPTWQMLQEYKTHTPNVLLMLGVILSFFISIIFIQKKSYFQKNLELIKFNSELEDFSYTIAHNLKAPLRHITCYINLIYKNQYTNLNDQNKQYMLNVNQSASKMDILIDSLLKYSTISRRKLKKTTFSLNTLVNSVISNLKLDKSKKIQWKFTEMPVIYADKFLLTILFKEIFINSIKFSKPDKTVTITIESNKTKQGTIINVKDEGIGVQFKYQEKAFLLFHQLDTKDYANGIGAGLAYARKIIERHQGTICFTADSDNGATLCMFFPDTYE